MEQIKQAWARARDWWVRRSAAERSNLIKLVAVTGGVVFLMGAYYLNKGTDSSQKTKARPVAEVFSADDYLDRDIDERIESAVQRAISAQLKAFAEQDRLPPEEEAAPNQDIDDLGLGLGNVEADAYRELDDLNFGEPLGYPEPPAYTPVEPMPEPVPQRVGNISSEAVFTPPPPPAEPPGIERVPIPPGFMPAMLLVGVHAQVSQDGSSNPKPIHLRVQAPATLPNKVKMNLEGCFVIANTWGNLSSERIEAETVSLTCMTSDKKTIISGPLKGYLADQDGQRDMAARVVTKAGSLIGRQVLADALGGFGNSVSSDMGNTVVSPLGAVTTIDGDEALRRGAASGIAGGFQGASEYISTLIEQSGPVLESGAAREVMIMVQELSWLTIQNVDDGLAMQASQVTEGS